MAEERDGCIEAYEQLDKTWFAAIKELRNVIKHGDDENRIEAARVLLEYGSTFTQLGAPYVPDEEPS